MMQEARVIFGWGNSKGDTLPLFQQKYQTIQRMNLKPSIGKNPQVKCKKFPAIECNALKSLITKKRSSATINSLLQPSLPSISLNTYQSATRARILQLQSELSAIGLYSDQMELEQFMRQTGQRNEERVKQYLRITGGTAAAINLWRQRRTKVIEFAKKHAITQPQAQKILQENEYNVKIFDQM